MSLGNLAWTKSSLSDLEVAALLHDIGKIGIPDAILHKPAKLTGEEYSLMKKHPEYGWAVMRNVPGMECASLMILHHHESYDGKGYPAGLKGEEIPIGSRIVSVIDAFDAMVSSRPYRAGMPYRGSRASSARSAAARSLIPASSITSFPSRVPRCPPYLPPPGRASPLPCSRGTYPESCKKLMDASCVPSIYANKRLVVTNWMSAVPL